MKVKRIVGLYFSATGGTEKVVCEVCQGLSLELGVKVTYFDITHEEDREKMPNFNQDDLVVVGVPVYSGRVPKFLSKYLMLLNGNECYSVPVVTYGNRHYDDALLELKDILTTSSFNSIAGGAFVAKHSFTDKVGMGRPNDEDLELARELAEKVGEKFYKNDFSEVAVSGNIPYKPFKPVDPTLPKPVSKRNDDCIDCKICVNACPVNAIDFEDTKLVSDKCIKCCSCIQKCPKNARFFDDEGTLKVIAFLEDTCKTPKQSEIFY